MNTAALITTGDIARELGCPLHRVTYVVQRFGVREDMRVGAYRLFRRERLPQIAALVRRLALKEPPAHESKPENGAPDPDDIASTRGGPR